MILCNVGKYLLVLPVQSFSKRNNLEMQTTSILPNLFYTKSTAFVKLKKKIPKGILTKGKYLTAPGFSLEFYQ